MQPQRIYGFSAIFSRNSVLILTILVINRVQFKLHSSLDLGMLFRRSYFSSLSIRPSTKSLHKLCSQQFNIGQNYGTNCKAIMINSISHLGHKYGIEVFVRSLIGKRIS